jgi:hypothetical protein
MGMNVNWRSNKGMSFLKGIPNEVVQYLPKNLGILQLKQVKDEIILFSFQPYSLIVVPSLVDIGVIAQILIEQRPQCRCAP